MVKWHSSIKLKIALPIFGVATLFTMVVLVFSTSMSLTSALSIESESAQKSVARVVGSLQQEISYLGNYANDWAYWDDTYDYLGGGAPNYEKSNLNDESLRIAQLGFLSLLNVNGDVVWSSYLNPKDMNKSSFGAPTSTGEWDSSFLGVLENSGDGIDGYYKSDLGLIMLSARPVLTSHRKGDSRGWLIVGRWVDERLKQNVESQTQQPVIFSTSNFEMLSVQQGVSKGVEIQRFGLFALRARQLIYDYKGDPILMVEINSDRSGFVDTLRTLLITSIGLIVIVSISSFLAYRRVLNVVVAPLSELIRSMSRVDCQFEDFSNIDTENGDEIALLYRKYREMSYRLMKIQGELKTRADDLEVEALTDPLTGLNNRRYMRRLMHECISGAGADVGKRLFITIDVDLFKKLNDTYGHPVGDSILVKLAQILKSTFRDNDHVIRLGGEEFIVITSCSKGQHGEELAERVRKSVESSVFDAGASRSVPVTVSVGYCWIRADSIESWAAALDLSDRALYEAKEAGRNQWRGYNVADEITQGQLIGIPDNVEMLIEQGLMRKVSPTSDQL